MPHPFRLNAIASLFVAIAPGAFAAGQEQIPQYMNVVIVSGSRVEHTSFDFPAAIDVVGADRIQDSQMRVNVSEALAAVPGLVIQNRQNYAQDLQISSRGCRRPAYRWCSSTRPTRCTRAVTSLSMTAIIARC